MRAFTLGLWFIVCAFLMELTSVSAFENGVNNAYRVSVEDAISFRVLATVVGEGKNRKAILKHLPTQKVDSYIEGSVINIEGKSEVKVVKILTCTVVIKVEDQYKEIGCEDSNSSISTLQGYHIEVLDRANSIQLPKRGLDYAYSDHILETCSKYNVDPFLVKAIIKAESDFNPFAVSPKNAVGLMQLLPETAREYGVEDLFDPESNIDGGVRFLRDLLDYFKDTELAIAAYNAGKGSVIKYNNTIPPYPETRRYVEKVMMYYDYFKKNKSFFLWSNGID